MFIYAVAFSFAVALLRGGRLKQLPDLRYMWLPPLAFSIQLVNVFARGTLDSLLVTVVTYSMILAFLLSNAHGQGLRIVLLGTLLNFAAMLANVGRIPVDVAAVQAVGLNVEPLLAGTDIKHVAMNDATLLPFLGDVIPITFPVARVLSIGDIFIFIGAFLIVQEIMGKRIFIFGSGGQN